MEKDDSIIRFLRRLGTRLPVGTYEVTDHWDADLFAIGVTNPAAPGRLVYISTYNKPHDRYLVECEEDQGGDALPKTSKKNEDADLAQVVEMIRAHLKM